MPRLPLRDCLPMGIIAGGFAVTGVAALAAEAERRPAPPDFSAQGWFNENAVKGGGLVKIPGQPYFQQDPRYPYVPNNSGAQPTYWIADLASNPNVKQRAKDVMKARPL